MNWEYKRIHAAISATEDGKPRTTNAGVIRKGDAQPGDEGTAEDRLAKEKVASATKERSAAEFEEDIIVRLNKLGVDGWELVSVVASTSGGFDAFLKRPPVIVADLSD